MRAALAALALASCGGAPTAFQAPPPQYYQPEPGALPWAITGELQGSRVDTLLGSNEAVTIRINGEVAAVGGFAVARGSGEGRFIGAYGGQRINVHCAADADAKSVNCEIAVGTHRAAVLTFATQE